ncbi:serine/threonine-protein kinase [Actinomadura sp. NTSP31]|uniref:serine/threonine-protein kinase n=1 Tax=Actinomadura sp. NTSP31 TaxID=1735447 RepID=UPI0035BF3080
MDTRPLPARVRPPRPADPRWIGAYEVAGFLGEGGMGSVLVGRGRDGRLVAIKVIRPELAGQPQFRARFRREARNAMRVPRFCTAEVLDADPDAPAPYLVTEYIDAPTLKEAVRASGPLRGAELEQLGVTMAAALASIHGCGVVHRDLKPGNVLLSRFGPRVIDFGIAKAVDETRMTGDDQVLGTPAYMAPEQLRGRPVPASDVFAWGTVMVFAATGRRPFGGRTLTEMAAAILNGEPDLSGLTGTLRATVAAALAKDAGSRPAPARILELLGVTAAEMARSETAARVPSGGDPVPERTRTDLTTGAFTPPRAPGPSLPPPDPASARHALTAPPDERHRTAGTRPDGGDGAVPEEWDGWTPERMRRRRRASRVSRGVLGAVTSALIVAALLALLLVRGGTPLRVEDVSVRTDKAKYGCGANVDVTATFATNGAPGDLAYRWKRSDQDQPGPRMESSVERGTKTTTVHLYWRISGPGKHRFTATVMLLDAPGTRKSTAFTYSCK